MLSRDDYPLWQKEDYENIGRFGYRDFDERDVERRVYDPFGVYLIDGVPVFALEETRTRGPERGSGIFKSPLYPSIFRNLMIGMDSYRGWAASIMVGDAVPTRFSSLTLNLSRLNGIRFDASSRKSSFSIVGSRISDPVLLATGLTQSGVQVNPEGVFGRPTFGSYLIGGHWETTLGNVLTLGSTYVNVHNFDSVAGRDEGSLKGVVPFSGLDEARSVFVIVSDDSHWDGNGPKIFRIDMYVDGELRDDIEPMVRMLPSVPALVGEAKREIGLGTSEINLRRADRPSWLIESYQMEEIVREGYDPRGRLSNFTSGGLFFKGGVPVEHEGVPFLRAEGTDVLVYRFEVPPGTREVRFRALAAGDYVIDVASALGWIGTDVQWRDWHTVKRAPNNVRDDGNMGWVTFRYGFPTGMALFGLDFEASLLGFRAWGEFARNRSYFKFPSGQGGAPVHHRGRLVHQPPPGHGRLGPGLRVHEHALGLRHELPRPHAESPAERGGPLRAGGRQRRPGRVARPLGAGARLRLPQPHAGAGGGPGLRRFPRPRRGQRRPAGQCLVPRRRPGPDLLRSALRLRRRLQQQRAGGRVGERQPGRLPLQPGPQGRPRLPHLEALLRPEERVDAPRRLRRAPARWRRPGPGYLPEGQLPAAVGGAGAGAAQLLRQEGPGRRARRSLRPQHQLQRHARPPAAAQQPGEHRSRRGPPEHRRPAESQHLQRHPALGERSAGADGGALPPARCPGDECGLRGPGGLHLAPRAKPELRPHVQGHRQPHPGAPAQPEEPHLYPDAPLPGRLQTGVEDRAERGASGPALPGALPEPAVAVSRQ